MVEHLKSVALACVASVSVGLSSRWRRFSLFGCAKIGASATLMEAAGRGRRGEVSFSPFPSPSTHFFAPAPIFPRPEKRKVHRTYGKPYRNTCYAGYVAPEYSTLFSEPAMIRLLTRAAHSLPVSPHIFRIQKWRVLPAPFFLLTLRIAFC